MNIKLALTSVLRSFRNKVVAKHTRALMIVDSPKLKDECAGDFFTVIDGQEVTFGELNARTSAHFANERAASQAQQISFVPRAAE